MELKQALEQIRKEDKKKFEQSIDLIVNLKGIDVKKDNIAAVVTIPHKVKDKKVCGFLTKKSDLVKTITQPDFQKYKDKKALKLLIKEYDFFIGVASLMPSIATNFGKALGPTGKMPTPQLGVLMKEDDAAIKQLIAKIDTSVKVRIREPSVKISIARESMQDSQVIENIESFYNGLVNALPTKKENVKSVMIKTTMGKPVKVEMK